MPVIWSPHAAELLDALITALAREAGVDIALKWEIRLRTEADALGTLPLSRPVVPAGCFLTVPPNAENLRQCICGAFRIVYEPTDTSVNILSVRHYRQILRATDTCWNDAPAFANE